MIKPKIQKSRLARYPAFLGALAALTLVTQQASAVLLAPNTNIPAVGSTTEASGNTLADITVPITGIFDIAPGSNIRELVVRRTSAAGSLAAGGLDFYFQINNAAASSGDIKLFVTNFYGGFQTDVVYDSLGADNSVNNSGAGFPLNGLNEGAVEPRTFDRSNGIGNSLTFDFPQQTPSNPGNDTIAPGLTSRWIVIRTDAPSFGAGIAGIGAGITGNYAVLGPIPEPTTALFGAALVGMTLMRRTRREQRA